MINSAKTTAATNDRDAELALLFAQWEAEQKRIDTRARILRFFGAAFFALCLCSITYWLWRIGDGQRMKGMEMIFVSVLGAFHAITIIVAANSPSNKLKDIGACIRRFDDVRAIPYVLQAYQSVSARNAAMSDYLINNLRNLKADNASLMKPHLGMIAALVILPKGYSDWQNVAQRRLVLSALEALKQVGDASVLTVIEKVAARTAKNKDEQKIIDSAQDCLEYLRARIAAETATETLLRPAMSHASAETLLRPARDVNAETAPMELLRVPHDTS